MTRNLHVYASSNIYVEYYDDKLNVSRTFGNAQFDKDESKRFSNNF